MGEDLDPLSWCRCDSLTLYVGIQSGVAVFGGNNTPQYRPAEGAGKGKKNSGSDLVWQFDLKQVP